MMPFGKETEEKIARHRRLRAGKGFETIECYTDLKKAAEVLQTKENRKCSSGMYVQSCGK